MANGYTLLINERVAYIGHDISSVMQVIADPTNICVRGLLFVKKLFVLATSLWCLHVAWSVRFQELCIKHVMGVIGEFV